MDEEEIIDVEIPIPPQAKRKEIQNGTDIPLPPGASLKKNESTAVPPIGGSDSKNGSISSQNTDTGLTDDLGLGLFQQPQEEAQLQDISNIQGMSIQKPDNQLTPSQEQIVKSRKQLSTDITPRQEVPFEIGKGMREATQKLAANPNDDAALYELGYYQNELGNTINAENFFTQAIEKNPNNVRAIIGLGSTNSKSGNHDESLANYEKALTMIAPKVVDNGVELDNPMYGNLKQSIAQNQLDLAKKNPDSPTENKFLTEAQNNINEALKINPTDVRSLTTKSLIQAQNNQSDEAAKTMTEAQQQYMEQYVPVATIYSRMIEEQRKRGETDTRSFVEQYLAGHENLAQELGGGNTGEFLAGALDIPGLLIQDYAGFVDGMNTVHEGLKAAADSNIKSNPVEFYTGIAKALKGSAHAGMSIAMASPAGLAFQEATGLADYLGNEAGLPHGMVGQIIAAPLTTLIPMENELGKELFGIGDIAVSLVGLGVAHAALKGDTGKAARIQTAKEKYKSKKPITGNEAKTLLETVTEEATPENLGRIEKAAESLPTDTPQEKIPELTERLATINPATLSKIPEDLKPETKIEVAPLIEEKQNLEKQKEKVDESFHPEIDESIEQIKTEINEKIKSSGLRVRSIKPKTETDASSLRENQESVLTEGRKPEELQDKGSEDLQRGNQEKQPINAEIEQQAQELISPEKILENEKAKETQEAKGLLTKPEAPTKDAQIADIKKRREKELKHITPALEGKGGMVNANIAGKEVSGNIGKGFTDLQDIELTKEEKKEVLRQNKLFDDKDLSAKEISDWKREFSKKVLQRLSNEINAKYDAELAALEKPSPTKDVPSILNQESDLKDGKKVLSLDFENGANAKVTIDGKNATIALLFAPKNKEGVVRGTRTFERVLRELSDKGIKTISSSIQSHDFQAAARRLVNKGILENPRDHVGTSYNRHPTKFDINKAAIEKEIPSKESKPQQPIVQEKQVPKTMEGKEELPVLEESQKETLELAVEPSKESGIAHELTAESRKEFGLDEYEGRNPKKDAELNDQAETKIKEGYNVEGLLQKLEKGDAPDELETVIMKKYKAGLEAKIEKDPSDANLTELRRFVDASDKIGSSQGAAFRQRQGLELRDDSLAGFFTREQDINLGAPLTETQKSKVQKEYEDIKAANENWQKEFDRVSAENAKLKAQQEIKKTKSTTPKTKKTHEDFVTERASLIEQLKQEWKGSPDQPTRSGLPITDKMVAITAKLMKSYVEEGVVKLEEIIKKLHEDLKGVIPEITEKDVNDIIAGEYKKQKPTKSDVAARLFDLREQARLTNKLDALLRGEEPKNERQKIKRNQEIESLRQKIKDFRKEKADAEKAGKEQKTKKSPDQIALDAIKTRQRNEISKLQKQLDTGDFATPEKKAPIKLDKEAQAARDQLIKLRQEREVRIMKQEYANRNIRQRAIDKIIDVLNVPRTIMSSMDFSAPLRQAIIPTLTHPSISMKAFGEMFRQSVSQKRFDRWFNDVKDHPRNKMAEDAGLYIADPHDPRLTAKEEAFMNNLAEKIPVIGKLIKGSERAYVGYLNKMRWDLFNRFADMFEESGKTFENSPELYKGLADWVNNSTGRGNLGKLESIAPILNTGLFSPRLIASRLNMLNPVFYKNLPKEVRVAALKDNLKFIGMGMAVLAVAELAGADVEVDPRSSDFGKIQVGNTRWDIWGGYQQYIRVLAQMATGQSKSASTDNINELTGKGAFGKTRGDVALSFLRGKLAPIPAVGADILVGRTIQGEDVTLLGELESHMLPLVQGDVREAMKDTGIRSLFTAGIPAVFGIGVQTYLPSGYNKTKLNDPTYKFLYDKHLNINEPKQGEMTDKEYKAFLPKREKIFKEEWKAAIKFGVFINEEGNPTVDPDAAKTLKKINELSQEELSKLMKSISAKATRDANPKPEKEKSEIEPSEELLIEKQRRKAPAESEEMIVTE